MIFAQIANIFVFVHYVSTFFHVFFLFWGRFAFFKFLIFTLATLLFDNSNFCLPLGQRVHFNQTEIAIEQLQQKEMKLSFWTRIHIYKHKSKQAHIDIYIYAYALYMST